MGARNSHTHTKFGEGLLDVNNLKFVHDAVYLRVFDAAVTMILKRTRSAIPTFALYLPTVWKNNHGLQATSTYRKLPFENGCKPDMLPIHSWTKHAAGRKISKSNTDLCAWKHLNLIISGCVHWKRGLCLRRSWSVTSFSAFPPLTPFNHLSPFGRQTSLFVKCAL